MLTRQLSEKYKMPVPDYHVRRALDILEALGTKVQHVGRYRIFDVKAAKAVEREMLAKGHLQPVPAGSESNA
jgi:uncharacterized SAM-binding protein YcdF (DUF218 family)